VDVPAPETITVPAPGTVTGTFAVPFLRFRTALPTSKELSGAWAAASRRGPPEGGAAERATPERDAVSGPFAELLFTVTSAVALPATLGSKETEK
jgi:hypothetical protein